MLHARRPTALHRALLAAGLAHSAPDQYRACHATNQPKKDLAEEDAPVPYLARMILRGRELAGEPGDFQAFGEVLPFEKLLALFRS